MRAALLACEWLLILSAVVLVVVFSMTGYMLPVPVAAHSHTGTGLVGKYGMRQILLVLFIMCVAIDSAFVTWARFPDLYRYPVPITAANIGAQYYLAKIMLALEGTFCTLYFAALMCFIYEVRIHMGGPNFTALTVGSMSAMAGCWVAYFLLARKYR